MKEKYLYIEPEKARELLSQIKEMKAVKRGFDSHVYLIGEYAVLTTSRIKLRNVTTRDDDLAYFDELIETLMSLHKQGVAVVPILGYCFDPDSVNGTGYIFQPRAKGDELYDDAVLIAYYVWAHNNPDGIYHFPSDIDPKEYILYRTHFISKVPQKHFDKFVKDIMALFDNDILIDFIGKSNFFYDNTVGFQFIDLDSHTDYKYGLVSNKIDIKKYVLLGCFTPCHLDNGITTLEVKAISKIGEDNLRQLACDNKTIFQKCKNAMLNNSISETDLNNTLDILKIFGA